MSATLAAGRRALAGLVVGATLLASAPVFAVPLVIYIVCNAPRASSAARKRFHQGMGALARKLQGTNRRDWLIAGAIWCVMALVVIWQLSTSHWFLFIVLTITGNWSPDHYEEWFGSGHFFLAISILVAIVLNLGPWIFVIERVNKILNLERAIAMRHDQAIATKEQMQKQRLYILFGRDHSAVDIINEGFTLGSENWRSHLGSMYSQGDVADFFEMYRGDIQEPKPESALKPPFAIAAKEQMQKQRLYVLFGKAPSSSDLIDKGFALGESDWKSHLESMFTSDEVGSVLRTYPPRRQHKTTSHESG